MTLQHNSANTHAPAILGSHSPAEPRPLTSSLPIHARIVEPGTELQWPEFPAGGCDPDFPGSSRPRRPSRLGGVVHGVLRFVRG